MERHLEHLLNVGDKGEFHLGRDARGQLEQVLLVARGQDAHAHARAVRADDLLLDATHGQHEAAQGDLARHRDVVAHEAASEQRGERRDDGDAGRRAVLGDGALGEVQVHVGPVEQVVGLAQREARARVGEAEPRRGGAQPGEGGARALLHDVAQLAGEGDLAGAAHLGRLDVEHVAAEGRVREADGHARLGHLQRAVLGPVELDRAQHRLHLLERHHAAALAHRRLATGGRGGLAGGGAGGGGGGGGGIAGGVVGGGSGVAGGGGVVGGGGVGVGLLHPGDARGGGAAERGELPLELAHARLARVAGDDGVEGGRVARERGLRQPVLGQLLGQQVAARDLDLLLDGVAVHVDDLHAVEQRPWDGLQLVGRRDEEDAAQVEGQVEEVVAEGVVLLGVEHLEQRRGGVAIERVAPELVDLIEHDDAVVAAALLDTLQDEPGHRAHVRAPVAAHLGLGVHAAQRDAVKVAPQRRSDALAQRGLADAGRAVHAQDRAFRLPLELGHREELEDALLHLGHAEVVVGQLRLGGGERDGGVRRAVPRQLCDVLEVVHQRRVLRVHWAHPPQPLQVALRHLWAVGVQCACSAHGARAVRVQWAWCATSSASAGSSAAFSLRSSEGTSPSSSESPPPPPPPGMKGRPPPGGKPGKEGER